MSLAEETHVEHPGVFVRDELEARGWDQSDLAFIVGTTVQELNKVLNGKGKITLRWAQLFSAAFDVNAEFFLRLQALHDLRNEPKPEPGVRIRADWVTAFPVREMIRRGWIQNTEADLLGEQMRRFFGATSAKEALCFGTGRAVSHAAKKTNYDEILPSQLAWLHRVRQVAGIIEAPPYDEEKLRQSLGDIKAHMLDRDDLKHIPQLLAECGVKLVFVEALAGAKIDGVCTWRGERPIIGLSCRLNRIDNFCFVLRHEIEHVLQKDGQEREHVDIFEPGREDVQLTESERRADAAAADFLIPQDKLVSFMDRKGQWISEKDVLGFSARHQVHPGVAVGQIQHRRHSEGDANAYRWLRKYQVGIVDCFETWPLRDGWGAAAEVEL